LTLEVGRFGCVFFSLVRFRARRERQDSRRISSRALFTYMYRSQTDKLDVVRSVTLLVLKRSRGDDRRGEDSGCTFRGGGRNDCAGEGTRRRTLLGRPALCARGAAARHPPQTAAHPPLIPTRNSEGTIHHSAPKLMSFSLGSHDRPRKGIARSHFMTAADVERRGT
jgi:hypothetical protein